MWCMWMTHFSRKGQVAVRAAPPTGKPSPHGSSTTYARTVPSTYHPLSARSGWLRIPKHLRVLRMRLSLLATTLGRKNKDTLRKKNNFVARGRASKPRVDKL